MPSLADTLQEFNRKERYWLLRHAIGEPFQRLSPAFLRELEQELSTAGRPVSIPDDAWWAFDYHIDWLYGALWLSTGQSDQGPFDNSGGRITATQEDFDLIVAFGTTLIIVEAKASTGWTNSQLLSKVARLQPLAELAERADPRIEMFFVMASPSRPTRLRLEGWPSFATGADGQPFHVPLPMQGPKQGFRTICRCDAGGKITSKGDHWRFDRWTPRP